MPQIIQKTVTLPKNEFFEKHLEIINPLIPKHLRLTPMEIKVVAAFMGFEGEVAEEDRFCTALRKIVMKRLGITGPGLSNYITQLTRKGVITEKLDGGLKILDYLLPEQGQQFYQFKLYKQNEASTQSTTSNS